MIINFVGLFFKNIKKNKKVFFSSIFLFLSLIILITTMSLAYSFEKYVDNDNENNIRHRTFMVYIPPGITYEELKNDLLKIDGINQVTSNYGYSWNGHIDEFINENYDGTIRLYGIIEENLPHVVDGSLERYNDSSIINIMCPQKLIPDSLIIWDKNWKMKPIVNASEYLEKKLSLVRSDDNLDIRIIATYDNRLNNADNFHCFTNPDNLHKIYNLESNDSLNDGYVVAVVNKYSNIFRVMDKLNSLGLNYSVVQETSDDIVSFIVKIGFSLTFVMTIFSILTIFFAYKKMIKSRNVELYTYRILGYSNSQINLILIIENFIINFIVSIFSILISLFILGIFKFYLNNSIIGNSNIRIYFNYFSLIYMLIFSFVIPFFVILVSFRNSGISLISKIKKEN